MTHPTTDRTDETPKFTILNAKTAAELLGIHPTTLYEAAKRGEIPCRRVGRRFIFIRETLLDWLLGRGSSAA